jgi:hypothetical protein
MRAKITVDRISENQSYPLLRASIERRRGGRYISALAFLIYRRS